MFFVADEELDIYPEGFGLEPVSLKTHQETPEEVNQAVADLKSLISETKVPSEPVSEPESFVVPVPVAEQETMSELDPDPVIVPSPMVDVPEIELVEPEEEAEPVETAEPVQKPEKAGGKGLKALIVVAVVLILIVAAYMAVGRLCPGWIDGFLYTPEELEILRR